MSRTDLIEEQDLLTPVDFVIIAPLEEERKAVLAKLPGYRQLKPSETDIWVYYAADLPVTFPDDSTGIYKLIVMSLLNMGRVQATIATAHAIHRWQPRYIILTGIAGGVTGKKVKVGDLLISDQIVDYELQKLTPTRPQIRWEIHRADPRLLSAVRNFSDGWQALISVKRPTKGTPKFHIGPIASGDKVIASGEVLAEYEQTWSKLIGVEMEAGGVATATFQSAQPPGFFMIRGVSDLADRHKNTLPVEKWRSYACDVAASYTVALLKSGPVPELANRAELSRGEQYFNRFNRVFRALHNRLFSTLDSAAPSGPAQEAQIFLCYAREDASIVDLLYHGLTRAGFKPWMDTKNILPGENWKLRIREAIQNSHFFLACLSDNALNGQGYLQEEIKQALGRLEDHIYLIPVRLEECQPPEALSELHWVDLFKEDGWARLLEAIQTGFNAQKGYSTASQPNIESPYGTMSPDSEFYVERITDLKCWQTLNYSQAMTIFVQAPRQMGKSSLMRRMLNQAENQLNKQGAFIDFQNFPEQYFTDEESFLIEFCFMIGEVLGIPEAIDPYWQGRFTNIRKCTRYLSEYIIPNLDQPFILAIDEIERMMGSPFRTNFFGMLRSWHNERGYNKNFAEMTLFLSGAVDPYLLIDNPYQSPFNVAEHILLEDFTQAEIETLNRRHNSPLDSGQVRELIELVGGHPFLVRLALYQLATGKIDMSTLLVKATEDTGLFGNHLHHHLLRVSSRPELKQVLIKICRTQQCEEDRIFQELKGLGLIKKTGQKVVLRNNLYARYFNDRLRG